jgi:predicted acyltransferase
MTSWSLLSGIFALTAYLFKPVLPISRPLWTLTFTLFVDAISLMELSAITYIVDYAKLGESASAWVAKPVNVILNAYLAVSKNPLAIYMASELIAANFTSIPIPSGANGEEQSLWSVLFQYVFAIWLPIRLNSLVWSGAWIVLLYVPLAIFMDRRGWYFRI